MNAGLQPSLHGESHRGRVGESFSIHIERSRLYIAAYRQNCNLHPLTVKQAAEFMKPSFY